MLHLFLVVLLPLLTRALRPKQAVIADEDGIFTADGFSSEPKVTYSAGHQAICVEGFLQIPLVAVNKKIFYDGPKNNYELTALLTEYMRVDSNVTSQLVGGDIYVADKYSIFSRLCLPANERSTEKQVDSVQFLTHGTFTDATYWDFAEDFSYIDAAAERGYATFSYDRLGSGRSEHPHPLSVVQLGVQTELAHKLIASLKEGKVAGILFQHVIGIGHAIGSAITQSVSAKHPDDFSALILSGHSGSNDATNLAMVSTSQQIASTKASRFKKLHNGYLTTAPVSQSMQFAFYHYPTVSRKVFKKHFKARQTHALGEMLTMDNALLPATEFSKPVLIINGRHDFVNCQGDCSEPKDLTSGALSVFYPNASSESRTENIPDIGHLINLHTGAGKVFDSMLDFLVDCQFSTIGDGGQFQELPKP